MSARGHDRAERIACAAARLLLRPPTLDLAAGLGLPVLRGVRLPGLRGHTVAEAVEGLLGPLPSRVRLAIARQIAATELRNRCLGALIATAGLGSLGHLVRCVDVGSLQEARAGRGGTLAITWHYGARAAIAPALHQLGMSALLFTRNPRELGMAARDGASGARVEFLVVGPAQDRAIHLTRAAKHLAAGGLVGIAVDGFHGAAAVEVPFLGRRVPLTRGPAVLARLTGAPMIPVAATWARDGAIEFRSFPPLRVPPVDGAEPRQWDEAVLAQAMRFYEELVRSAPGQLRAALLRRYWTAPALT